MSFQLPIVKLVFDVLDKTAAPIRGMMGRMRMMSKQSQQNLQSMGKVTAKAGALTLAATAGITVGAVAQRGATMNALNALESLGIKKLENLRMAGVNFSETWSGTTRGEFLEAAYDIKSGIESLSDEGVAATTTMAALTAKATKGMVQELAGTFATGHGIYRKFFKSDEEFAEQFGAGIAAATQAFKTDGSKMSQAITGLGASASIANVPLNEQLAVLGMLQQTMQPSQAGTAYRAFMDSLGKVTMATGQSFLDASGNAMSMTEILAKFGTVLKNAKAKGNAPAVRETIKKAFGREEAMAVLDRLIERQEELKKKITSVGEATKKGKAYTEAMAAVQNKGEDSSWHKITQSISNLAETIGKALSPVLLPLMNGFKKIVVNTRKWVEANPKLTRTIIMIAGALGVAAVAVGTLTAALAALALKQIIFAAAGWTNPIILIAAGITVAVLAIIAAGVLLYNYWDEIKVWWKGLWGEWGGVVATVLGGIVHPILGLIALKDLIVSNWDDIVPWFKNLWDGIVQAAIGPVKYIWQVIKWLLNKVKQNIKEAISWLPESAQNWVKGKLGMQVDVNAPAAKPTADQLSGAVSKASEASQVNQAAAAMRANQAARGGTQQGFKGKLDVEIKPPRGWSATVTQYDQSGDADFDVFAGLASAW